MLAVADDMIYDSLKEDRNFEEVRWSNLASEHGKEGDFSERRVSTCEEWLYLVGGNMFSQNGSRWTLLFGLKEEWERTFDANAEVAREKENFFNERGFEEEDESLTVGDWVTRPEVNRILIVKSFLEEGV